MAKPAIPEASRHHGQRACRQRLIDERLLPFERLDRGATGQGVFAGCSIGNLRVKLSDCSQPFCLPTVPTIERLAQDKLPARRIVAEIEPVGDVARLPGHASLDHGARGPRVHTPD